MARADCVAGRSMRELEAAAFDTSAEGPAASWH